MKEKRSNLILERSRQGKSLIYHESVSFLVITFAFFLACRALDGIASVNRYTRVNDFSVHSVLQKHVPLARLALVTLSNPVRYSRLRIFCLHSVQIQPDFSTRENRYLQRVSCTLKTRNNASIPHTVTTVRCFSILLFFSFIHSTF